MDMEKLNKSQLVLLMMFVSFISSITTGIVTVSLMEQAPPAITETVNRVVERTIERVVPGQVASAAEPVTKTVVVKESELIPKAVEAASPSVVRLYSSEATSSVFLGLGLVIDATGRIAVDTGVLGEERNVSVELSGSMRVPATVGEPNDVSGVTYLVAATSTKDGAIHWVPAQLSSGKPVLGQTVVMISGRSAARVAGGLVTALSPLKGDAGDTSVIETDISKDVIISGSPIISTDGVVLGMSTKTSRAVDGSGFVAANLLLPQLKEKKAETVQ